MKEAKIITDRSEVHRTYLIIYGTLGICLLGYAAMTVRYIWNMHQIPWMDVLTEIIFLLFLGSTALARSTYELHEKELVVISSSLFRTRKLAIPYSAIDGAFHFKVEPIKAISYRHTYRMYGSMDRRDIWSLVYNMPNTDKVSRVLMKASEEFWEAFEKKLPGRIRVSQEEVLKNAFLYSSISAARSRRRTRTARRKPPPRTHWKRRRKPGRRNPLRAQARRQRRRMPRRRSGTPRKRPLLPRQKKALRRRNRRTRRQKKQKPPTKRKPLNRRRNRRTRRRKKQKPPTKRKPLKRKKNKSAKKGSPEKETPLFYCLFPPDTARPSFPAAGSFPSKGIPHRSGEHSIPAKRNVISRRQSAPLSSGSPRERGLPHEGSARSGEIHTPR